MEENNKLDAKNGLIGRAVAWSFAAEIAAKLIVPMTNVILARVLAPEAFGIIATINMVVSFADTFSAAGFQKYIVQHDYKDRASLFRGATVAFWTNFAISVLGWMIIAIFNPQIAKFVGSPGYGLGLVIAALSLPMTSFSVIQEALFQRQLNYRVLFYRRLLVSFIPFVVTIPLACLGLGYWSLIIGTLAGDLLKAIVLTVASEWKPKLFFELALLKDMFSFSIWTLFESIAMWLSSYIDILIISNGLGAYYTGLYKNSQSTVTGILSIITGATTSVLFASLSRAQDDPERFKSIFYRFEKTIAIFVLPIGVGLFCFSDIVTMILLGNQWMEASGFIGIWGLCTSLVCVFGTFSREVYRAKGRPKISLLVQLLHLAFVVPVCIIGVQKGFQLLIYYRSFAFLQIIILHMLFIKFVFKISPIEIFINVKEPVLCSLIMYGFAVLGKMIMSSGIMYQLLLIFLCGCIYLGILCMFKSYREYLYEVLFRIKKAINSVTRKKSDDFF